MPTLSSLALKCSTIPSDQTHLGLDSRGVVHNNNRDARIRALSYSRAVESSNGACAENENVDGHVDAERSSGSSRACGMICPAIIKGGRTFSHHYYLQELRTACRSALTGTWYIVKPTLAN